MKSILTCPLLYFLRRRNVVNSLGLLNVYFTAPGHREDGSSSSCSSSAPTAVSSQHLSKAPETPAAPTPSPAPAPAPASAPEPAPASAPASGKDNAK